MMWWSGDGYWGHGWWWPGILVMAVFMIVCMVLMARMMRHGMVAPRARDAERDEPVAPERRLADRLAIGEIDLDDYQRLRDALAPTRTTDRA